MNAAYRKIKRSIWKMKKKKIKILHVAQAAGGVDRYIRMLLKYLDKEKFENILVCSQDFREKDYKNLVDFFEQVKMDRAIGSNDLKAIGEVRRLIKRYNPDIVYEDFRLLGDIYIAVDIAYDQAIEYNHSRKREVCFLATHGLLHLLGYDHMTEEEEKEMFGKQEELLKEYGINR
mgnify:CR=1 FL=1